MHRDLRKRALVITLLVLILVALTACGDEDLDAEGSNPTAAPSQPTMTAAAGSVETPVATPVETDPTATQPQPAGAEPTTAPDATRTPEPVIVEPTAMPDEEPEPETAEEPLPEPENPAPELAYVDEWYNSAPLTLAELRGSPVLLVFWATY